MCDDGRLLKNIQWLERLASFVVTFAAQRFPIRRDPRVNGSRDPVDSRNMVQPRDPAPVSKATCDLIGRVSTNVNGVVGCNQPHARVKVALNHFREPFGQPFRLSGNELERVAVIPTSNSSDPATTERAVTIVNESRLAA